MKQMAGYTSSIQLRLLVFTLILFCFLCCYSGLVGLFCLVFPCVYSVRVHTLMFMCILVHVQMGVFMCIHVDFTDQPQELILGLPTTGHQSLCSKLLGITPRSYFYLGH